MAKECDSKTCDKTSCEGCSSKKNPQSMQAAMNASSNVKHVIGIVSGKGGVGKSFVTASLANQMAKKGCKVGRHHASGSDPKQSKTAYTGRFSRLGQQDHDQHHNGCCYDHY